jgi:asparagine synthase (glutamine-hydrolysing)
MCGLIGGVSKDNLFKGINFDPALKLLEHRGPDAQGTFEESLDGTKILLGHRRLSIIDLTDSANQPFESECKKFVMVFNGEIYNYLEIRKDLISRGHIFRTNSDTEVLMHAWLEWGAKSLNKLSGMFSFALIDKPSKKLYLAVDHFGIKPLFYYIKKNAILFSSELNSLAQFVEDPLSLNEQLTCDYLLHGDYDFSEESFLQDIYKIMPAHYLEVNLDDCTVSRKINYWMPSIQEIPISYDLAKSKLLELLNKSIKLHKRSDVEICAALSGGIDSSSLVMLLNQGESLNRFKTFSYISETNEINEERWVDTITRASNTDNIKVYFNQNDLKYSLRDFVKSLDEPVSSLSTFAQYKVFEAVSMHKIKVSLDGQGADEIFAGYSGFVGYRALSLVESGKFFDMFKLIWNWSSWPGRSFLYGVSSFLSLLIPGSMTNFFASFFSKTKGFSFINLTYFRERGLRLNRFIYSSLAQRKRTGRKRRLIEKLRYQTIMGGGLFALLRHADRTSMKWSIESRVPFLNKDIVEFVFSLPEHFLLSKNGRTKNILRDALADIVPKEILDRKDKIGFAASEKELLEVLSSEIDEILNPLKSLNFINIQAIKDEFNSMLSSDNYSHPYLWRIINFSVWLHEYPMLKSNKNN